MEVTAYTHEHTAMYRNGHTDTPPYTIYKVAINDNIVPIERLPLRSPILNNIAIIFIGDKQYRYYFLLSISNGGDIAWLAFVRLVATLFAYRRFGGRFGCARSLAADMKRPAAAMQMGIWLSEWWMATVHNHTAIYACVDQPQHFVEGHLSIISHFSKVDERTIYTDNNRYNNNNNSAGRCRCHRFEYHCRFCHSRSSGSRMNARQ